MNKTKIDDCDHCFNSIGDNPSTCIYCGKYENSQDASPPFTRAERNAFACRWDTNRICPDRNACKITCQNKTP